MKIPFFSKHFEIFILVSEKGNINGFKVFLSVYFSLSSVILKFKIGFLLSLTAFKNHLSFTKSL